MSSPSSTIESSPRPTPAISASRPTSTFSPTPPLNCAMFRFASRSLATAWNARDWKSASAAKDSPTYTCAAAFRARKQWRRLPAPTCRSFRCAAVSKRASRRSCTIRFRSGVPSCWPPTAKHGAKRSNSARAVSHREMPQRLRARYASSPRCRLASVAKLGSRVAGGCATAPIGPESWRKLRNASALGTGSFATFPSIAMSMNTTHAYL